MLLRVICMVVFYLPCGTRQDCRDADRPLGRRRQPHRGRLRLRRRPAQRPGVVPEGARRRPDRGRRPRSGLGLRGAAPADPVPARAPDVAPVRELSAALPERRARGRRRRHPRRHLRARGDVDLDALHAARRDRAARGARDRPPAHEGRHRTRHRATARRAPARPGAKMTRLSDEIEAWLQSPGHKRLGDLVEVFGKRSFAIAFVLLLALPALPLPTGGVTHVFEVIAVLLALQLMVGREEIWLPRRLCERELGGDAKFLNGLLKVIRRVERFSRPRLTFMFGHRLSNLVFGLVVAAGSIAAFLAPPFTGLDTLPALGVVLISLGVLLEDFYVVIAGAIVLALGVFLEILLGSAAVKGIGSLF